MKIEMNLQIDKELRQYLDRRWLKAVAREAVSALYQGSVVELSLVFTGNERIRHLNKEYRGEDKPTDVLAFAMLLDNENGGSFKAPPDGVLHLGEVVISYPQAAGQAIELGHSVEQEIALLIIHGILHLSGYDHKKTDKGKRMQAKEREIMERFHF